MDEETRNRLAAKKRSLQAQQEVIAQSSLLADWWFPTLELVQSAGVEWRLEYLTVADPEQYPLWAMQLQKMPWTKFPPEKMSVFSPSAFIHESVTASFPGTHPLRYVPQLEYRPSSEKGGDRQTLLEAARQLGIGDQPVHFFFMRLSPVLQLSFTDLAALAAKGIFEVPEDSCIVPADLSWLIFRSLEGGWQYGLK